jgi:predicted DNA repair protein MutK
MNLSKPVTPVRKYAVGSVITALILLSPVVAFLMVIAAEMLIDLLMVGGTSAVFAVAAGSIGLVLSRKFWRRGEVVKQPQPEMVPAETSIAAAPM